MSVDPRENELLHRRVEELAVALAALRAEFEAHREALRRELVTEGVVVAGADGIARVALVAEADHGRVSVHARTASGEPTCVEMFANDLDGGGHVGVAFTEAGTVVTSVEVVEGAGTSFWST